MLVPVLYGAYTKSWSCGVSELQEVEWGDYAVVVITRMPSQACRNEE